MQELQEYVLPTDASVRNDLSMKDFGKICRRRRRVIWGVILGTLFVAILLSLIPHRWYAEAQLTLVQRAQSAQVNAQETYAAPWVESVGTPYDMIQTTESYQRALDWMREDAYEQGRDPKKIGYDLVSFPKHVKYANVKGSNTIDITSWAYNQKEAIALANAAAQSFVKWKAEQSQNDVNLAIENYRKRVRDAKAELGLAENRELQFKQAHKIADVSTQEKDFLTLMSQRQATLLEAQQDAASQQARLSALQSQLSLMNGQIATGTGVRDDAKVQDLQSKLVDAEIERNNLATKYTSAYPNRFNEVDQRIADYKAQLSQSIHGTIDNNRPSLQDQGSTQNEYRNQQVASLFAASKLAAAKQLYSQAQAQSQSFPAIDLEYVRLDRDVQTKTAQYNALVAALNQAMVDKNSITGDVQMTNVVVPDEFSRVQYTILFIAAGIALGLFLAVCVVLVLEQGDSKLYSVEEIRRLLSGPVIGALPEISRSERRALMSGIVPHNMAEVFNVARNNLQLVMRHYTQHDLTDNQVLLVTSAGPEEGKSMVAAQLARSIAESGRTVLLVDASLRREKEKGSFVPRNPVGFAQVLADGLPADEAIKPGGIENLFVMPSGEMSGHTTDLISLPTLPAAIESLRGKADTVIIDAPACTISTDALYMAPYADCVLQVIGAGVMDESNLADAVAAIQASSSRVVAYMMTKAPRPKRKAAKFHYYSLELNGYGSGKNGAASLNGQVGALLTGSTESPFATAAERNDSLATTKTNDQEQ